MRRSDRGRNHRQWADLAVVFLAFALAIAGAGCRKKSGTATESVSQVYQDAWLKLERGDLNAALDEADRELSSFPNQHTEWHWKFQTLKAEVLLRKRSNEQALALLQPTLPESLQQTDVAVWQRLTEGSASGYLYRFSDADQFLGQAQSIASQYHPELLGQVALRKGTINLLRGNTQQAESEYRQSLQIARTQSDGFLEAASLGSLGFIATQREQYDESLELNRTALDLSRSVGAEGSVANILGNMAWSLFELGDYDASLTLFQQAQDAAIKGGSPGAELGWKVDVGALDFYVHDYAGAKSELTDSLNLAQSLNQPSQIGACLTGLAQVDLSQGELRAAESYSQQALKQFSSIGDGSGEIATQLIEAQIESVEKNASGAQHLLVAILNNPHVTPSTLWEAEARLASVYRDLDRTADAEREFRNAIATVETARSSVQEEELRLSFLSNAIQFYDDYVEFLIANHRPDEALSVATLARAQTLIEGLGLQSAKSDQSSANWTATARREHATILDYWLGERHSYLWAISPSGQPKLFSLPAAAEIEQLVKSYGDVVRGPRNPLATQNAEGGKLYAILVEPAISLIPKGSRVVVVPDASLFSLNFETLIVKQPTPHYWIEDVTVVNANSLALIGSGLSAKPLSNRRLLLIGDPVSASDEFPTLPQASTEISDIEKHFASSATTVITGKDATPEAYSESQPAKFSYIHFVTHGTSSETSPLESAVVLSRQGDSFKLYGRDIVKLPLRGALVTISACHGEGSRNYSGEGLVGLSWAFLRAGARGVIAALWEVDDGSTAHLMDEFYEYMSEGDDAATALRKAKLSLLHSNSVYEKPFYWAPFQYYAGR